MASVDVFIAANNALIDERIYHLWLGGYSVENICHHLIQNSILSEMEGADEACVVSEINDQIRFFVLLEKYFENPRRLKDQCYFQLAPESVVFLTEAYYEVDDVVIRELLGKKLSAKMRKDLDDVSEKTRKALKSCRRQFDNFRRIFKTVEDMKGSLVSNIMQHYLLSEDLAKKYAAAVFITNNRFETGKKRLAYLGFDDFVVCANLMITHWSYSSVESRQDNMDVEVDREFLHSLKDLKTLLDKEVMEDVRIASLRQLEGHISDKSKAELETNFKTFYRTIVGIAVDLNHSRDLRDFFVVIVDKLVEMCKSARWTKADLQNVLSALSDIVKSHDCMHRTNLPSLAITWDRYYRVLSACVLRFYKT